MLLETRHMVAAAQGDSMRSIVLSGGLVKCGLPKGPGHVLAVVG
jgi:hypothetical protein